MSILRNDQDLFDDMDIDLDTSDDEINTIADEDTSSIENNSLDESNYNTVVNLGKDNSMSSDVQTQDNREAEAEVEQPKDFILYIITDKSNPSLLQYYRECGINVSKIFTNINDAKDTLLMQIDPVKILIIDTGSGRFSAMGSRRELIDLMGICDDDARISVYYTDTVIKSEIQYKENFEGKHIHWHKFKSNIDVVAHLMMNKDKENYVYDEEDKDKVVDTPDDILHFTGIRGTETREEKELAKTNAGEPSINLNDILVHMVNNTDTTDEIESYKITKI